MGRDADAHLFEVTPEMRAAGAYVLDGRYDVASGTIAESLAKQVFEEMIGVWLEANSVGGERWPQDQKSSRQNVSLAAP